MIALSESFHDSSGDTQAKLKSFFSTPNFLQDLTSISEGIMQAADDKEYLRESLQKMNKNLPANCYIPILTNSDRNYMVLNVRSEECVVFRTAEHAPFLVNLEVF